MTWLTDFLKSAGDFLRPAVDFLSSLPFGWIDFVTVLVICLGIVRGRKRGLSEEILDVTKWLIIVAAAAFLYRPLGDFLNIHPVLSPLSYYLIAYMVIISGVWLVFHYIKKRFGEKLSESDVFGRAEFYGGMVAGSVRWFCVYFVLLSMLHAPYYSDAERAQRKKEVDYNWGSDFFPSMVKIQDSVYKSSFTGQGSEAYLEFLLMEPVSGDTKPLRNENSLAKRRERAVDDAYGQK
jgi:hypothetical protein